ncbi:riboflavin biosynthesis RibT protein [Planomicrobium koreense]|uniref:Riboflavin biosynthesis RibT protein n=1 Tax=Planococcus koreensis TaxID=112331 RepID=A0A7W8CUG2_9BACL|nr:GNAT family N-acetyltransferase [Planococcus koreensis]MBB5180619.1 riboflavin biosynthesis RibT protein [Planococcus koreensis]
MLYRYKKSFKKVAMGLLSLTTKNKSVSHLSETIEVYEKNTQKQLYFWKEGENITGLAGVEIGDHDFSILHLSVNPSYPVEETGMKIVEELRLLMRGKEMILSRDAALYLGKIRHMAEDIMPYREEKEIS